MGVILRLFLVIVRPNTVFSPDGQLARPNHPSQELDVIGPISKTLYWPQSPHIHRYMRSRNLAQRLLPQLVPQPKRAQMLFVHQLSRIMLRERRIPASDAVFDKDIEGGRVRFRGGWFPFLLDGEEIVVIVLERVVRCSGDGERVCQRFEDVHHLRYLTPPTESLEEGVEGACREW